MIDHFAVRRDGRLHPLLYALPLNCFALARYWDGSTLTGPTRGRAFENAFYRACERSGLPLDERAGSRTLRGAATASGFSHESDAVFVAPDVTVHVELKHLSSPVSKTDLMVFNQKGLDFLLGGDPRLCRRPLHRVFVSGSRLSDEARRFALVWGIVTVEPDRLPLPLLHWILGSSLAPPRGLRTAPEEAWRWIPIMVAALQDRLRRMAECAGGGEDVLARGRIDHALVTLQRDDGALFWRALDAQDPLWLEHVWAGLVGTRPAPSKASFGSPVSAI
ncbi:hypothetical protein [Arenibaculum sp.]|jgi:hypothetical protein|uniref:hypothetical protein n=1 Tax=Arenibaculum sp. TaxID=2865862 RepID=UPI002E140A54|nr:hypothetical protein [Arenibaculum sp.]